MSNLDADGEGSGYLPFVYLESMFRALAERADIFNIISYSDLNFGDLYSGDEMYEDERDRWRDSLSDSDRRKVHILFQHDVDSVPEASMACLRSQLALGIRSNIMVFASRLNRKLLKETGEVVPTEYPLDWELMRGAERRGFVIGYHSNAFERSGYNHEVAVDLFVRDVKFLRERANNIEFFSPHGGVPSPNGENNYSTRLPRDLQRDLGVRWVHNRQGVKFDGQYSDGGFNNAKRDLDRLDLRAFFAAMKPGNRYRILLHPQYYFSKSSGDPKSCRAESSSWFMQARECWERGLMDGYWNKPLLSCVNQTRRSSKWISSTASFRRSAFRAVKKLMRKRAK